MSDPEYWNTLQGRIQERFTLHWSPGDTGAKQLLQAMDQAVAIWHRSPPDGVSLDRHLALTAEEYEQFVQDPLELARRALGGERYERQQQLKAAFVPGLYVTPDGREVVGCAIATLDGTDEPVVMYGNANKVGGVDHPPRCHPILGWYDTIERDGQQVECFRFVKALR